MSAAQLLLPLGGLAATSLTALVTEPFCATPATKQRVLPWIMAVGLSAVAVLFVAATQVEPTLLWQGFLMVEPLRAALSAAIVLAALAAVASAQTDLAARQFPGGEPYALIGLSTCGAVLLAHAAALPALFLGVELLSLPLYALIAQRRNDLMGQEASLKYLVMGALFSGVLLYGAALCYGSSGSLALGAPALAGRETLHVIGSGLLLIGLLFKLGAVPFHFWSPDAYAGAPWAITGYMAAVVKVAAISALATFWLGLMGGDASVLPTLDRVVDLSLIRPEIIGLGGLVLALGMLSILLGNGAALGQERLRRLLAYSSISHVGFLLLAFALPVSGEPLRLGAAYYYVAIYAVAVATLSLALAPAVSGRSDALENLAGFARRSPWAGVLASVALAALAGLPPTAGFVAKYQVFVGLFQGGQVLPALIALVLAVVGMSYYVRLMALLWDAKDPLAEAGQVPAQSLQVILATICAGLLLVLAAVPAPFT